MLLNAEKKGIDGDDIGGMTKNIQSNGKVMEEESRNILNRIPGSSSLIEMFLEDDADEWRDSLSINILSLIHERVIEQGSHIAIVNGEARMTYDELWSRSDAIASFLREKGAEQGDLIAVLMDPQIDVIPTIIGILKTGASYLPLDSYTPDERIRTILSSSGCRYVATDLKNQDRISYEYRAVLPPQSTSPSFTSAIPLPIDVCYVIYTSGSTGTPKGVVVQHRALMNLCRWHIRTFALTERDHTTRYAGFGFDAAVWEIFPSLIAGATIYQIPEEIRLDLKKLNEYFMDNAISVSFLPTPICEQFLTLENHSLRILLTGGDKLNHFSGKHSYRVFNNYGPTENTVVATSLEVIENSSNIPIGKPIDGVQAYVMDKKGRLCPPFAQGELYLGGASLARGYLYDEEKTKAAFVETSFGRLYRTGDLVRWDEERNLLFYGRKDHQVKINGNRIELGEIEHTMCQFEGINGAVVLIDTRNEIKHLIAYFVSTAEISLSDLRSFLSDQLPYYMIPEYFMALEEFPLTANGKIDRKALPTVSVEQEEDSSDWTETEARLGELWKELLGRDDIRRNDHFMDAGGNSILVVKMKQSIDQWYPNTVTISDIFGHPSISSLSLFIDQKQEKKSQCSLVPIKFSPATMNFLQSGMESLTAESILQQAIQKQKTEDEGLLSAVLISCYAISLQKFIEDTNIPIYVGTTKGVMDFSLPLDEFKDLVEIVEYVQGQMRTRSAKKQRYMQNVTLTDGERTLGLVLQEDAHALLQPSLDFGVIIQLDEHDLRLSVQYRKMDGAFCRIFLQKLMTLINTIFIADVVN